MEALAMGAKIRAICGCRVFLAGLCVLGMLSSTLGCGTSFMEQYRASLHDTGKPRFNRSRGKIEHNLFDGRYQNLEKEDWEDD
jgi:hypothetical protein